MPLNLLVADDSATIHKVISLAFEGEDVTVITAGDGQEALDKASETRPDIIFADTEMPRLDGFELCQKIKENEELKKIPVCLIHSDFEEFDEEKYNACGADSYINKPFKSQEIVSKVAEMTGRTGKEEKGTPTLTDNLPGKENMESKEKPQEDLDELEILPLDELEEETQENGAAIELKLEDTVDTLEDNDEVSIESVPEDEPPENEIEDFMEAIETDNKAEESDIKKELDEFNEVLNIADEELGEAEPFTEDKKSEPEDELETIMSGDVETDEALLEETLPEIEELAEEKQVSVKIETPKETPKSADVEIKEEKEDLIEDTGILPNSRIETPSIETPAIEPPPAANKLPKGINQITEDEFERLVGGYIKQVIEKILKDAIQGEISTITDKIIEAVERIAHEITPDISKTIIQKEIEKIKNQKD